MRQGQRHSGDWTHLFRHEGRLLGVVGAYVVLCIVLLFTLRAAAESMTRAALEPPLKALVRSLIAAPGAVTPNGLSAGARALLPADAQVSELDLRAASSTATSSFEGQARKLVEATPGSLLTQFTTRPAPPTLRIAVATRDGRVLLVDFRVGVALAEVAARLKFLYVVLTLGGVLALGLLGLAAWRAQPANSRPQPPESAGSPRRTLGLIALSLGAFAVDLFAPPGSGGGLAYFVPTAWSLASHRRADTWGTVIFCSVLMVARVPFMPPMPDLWITFITRTAAFGILWGIAVVGLWQRRSVHDKALAEAAALQALAATETLRSALQRTEIAEAELRDRQLIIDAVGRMVQVGRWTLDAATRTTAWSEEVYRILEVESGRAVPPEQAIEFYAPAGRALLKEAVRRGLLEGESFDLVLPLTTAKGNARWVRAVGSAVREGERITGLAGALQDVTEHYETQQRLARASRASSEGHWEYDFRTQTVWLSASFQELTGAPAQDRSCTRAEFWQMFEPEDAGTARAALSRHIASGAPYDVELRLRRVTGGTHWLRARGSVELDSDGEPVRFGGSILDIDTEKSARAELEALRSRHERALRGTHDGVWDWNIQRKTAWLSPRFRELLGYAGDDTVGLPDTVEAFRALVHPEDDARVLAASRRHLETGEVYDVEFRLRTRTGTYRWFRSRGAAERDANGAPLVFAGSVQDIDGQKAAEFERSEARRRLARAIDGSSDALFEVDLNGGTNWYSPRLRQMLGYGPDEPSPPSLLPLLSEEDREAILGASRRQLLDRQPCDVVVRVSHRSGGLRWLRVRWVNERDEHDTALRSSGSIQDVTAEREAEAAMRAATAAAAAANRTKGEFLANMSHEIRTPLNGVLGMTDLLLEGELAPDQRQYAETIRSSGSALLAIINDILDLSKIEAGKLTFERTSMDARECVQQAATLLGPQARQRGLRLETDVSPEVPARVRGDPLRLQQILLNLTGNALKFTRSGEVNIRVGLEHLAGTAATLRFEVRDTGIGMNADTVSRLFTAFTQADASTTRHYGGTGLGLSIVKHLLGQLGGSIAVTSELGRGSCFTFLWPCEVLEGEPESTTITARHRVPLAPASLRGRVLIVEDHPVNQQVARRQLERLGCSVVLAENGALGVAIAKAEPFDLILMDVQMPILDGLAATREIRAAELPGRRTPIIAVTASAMTDEIDRCREAGMDDLLTKPIDRTGLQTILARYLPASEPVVEPVLDQARVQALIEEDRTFAVTLAATFIGSAREMLLAIEAASAQENRAALATLAHKLEGAARSAGADELARLARRLELAAPGGGPESFRALNRDLRRAYSDTVASFGRLGLAERVA